MMGWVYLFGTLINVYLVIVYISIGLSAHALFALVCGILCGIGYWRQDV